VPKILNKFYTARCMLDTEGYRDTLKICNVYCFSTATIVAGTRINVTLY